MGAPSAAMTSCPRNRMVPSAEERTPLTVEGRFRALVAHEDVGFDDRVVSSVTGCAAKHDEGRSYGCRTGAWASGPTSGSRAMTASPTRSKRPPGIRACAMPKRRGASSASAGGASMACISPAKAATGSLAAIRHSAFASAASSRADGAAAPVAGESAVHHHSARATQRMPLQLSAVGLTLIASPLHVLDRHHVNRTTNRFGSTLHAVLALAQSGRKEKLDFREVRNAV